MALATYSDLQTAIAEWMGRPGDALVVARAPDFIALFEAWFKQKYRFRRMLKTAPLTITTETVALPTDFLAVRNILLNTAATEDMQHAGLDWIRRYYDANTSGQPKFFNVGGSTLLFAPAPDGTYTATLEYYAFASLSAGATSNWLLANYPHVYLRGALREAHGWAADRESMGIANAALMEAMGMMELEDEGSKMSSDSEGRVATWTP